MIDYEAEDLALDEELKALYAENSPDDGTEFTPTPETDSTEVDTPVEETVIPESRYKAAVQAMNKAQQDLAELRKQDAGKDAQLQDLQRQLTDKQTSTQVSDDADLDEVQENYPEIINPLLKKIRDLENKLGTVSDDVGNVKSVSQRYQQNEQRSADEQHREAIKAQHPDAYEIADSPEYADWYHNQAPLIQQALNQGTAQDVIAALDLYRAAHPRAVSGSNTKADKLQQARNAATPSLKNTGKPNQKTTYTNAQIAKMTRLEFKEHEEAIDAALARGEVF